MTVLFWRGYGMCYRGQVKGGVVILDPGAALPEGTVVRVEPVEPVEPAQTEASAISEPDPVFRMSELAVETGIRDLATNIDHYLYGHPKATNGG